jgi:3-oxoacyl-[acyl-carrier protein] reductase
MSATAAPTATPTASLAGAVALVTGGSRGIGRAICASLCRAGARVAFTYRTASAAAEEALALLAGEGAAGVARAYQADVSRPEDVDRLAQDVVRDFEGVDVLVNNAGINADGLLFNLEPESFERVLDVNLGGVYRMTRAFARGMMMRRWGRIVNVSSVSGAWGGRGKSNYAASKAAINAFTRACAIELAGKGITVNAVAPGMIATEMTEAVRAATQDSLRERIPARRYGEPEDIGPVVAFLASPQAGYLTGQVVTVDGGLTLC